MNFKEFCTTYKQEDSHRLPIKRLTAIVSAHPLQREFVGGEVCLPYISTSFAKNTLVEIVGSPEAYAITTALLAWNKKGLYLIPARLHTGPARAMDAGVACYQALQIPEIKKILEKRKMSSEEILLVDLLREGQKTQTPEAVNYLYSLQPTNVLLNIKHVSDPSAPLGRRAELMQPNMEGVEKKKVKTVILSDAVASGTNQYFALEFLRGCLPHLENVIIIAPHLTAYGASNLSRYLNAIGMKAVLVGYGALLESLPPDMYFSPTPVADPEKFADVRHASLMKEIYGVFANKLCVAGNWSAMFLSRQAGLAAFEEELKNLGTCIKKLTKNLPKWEQIKGLGFVEKDLIPCSTYYAKKNQDQR